MKRLYLVILLVGFLFLAPSVRAQNSIYNISEFSSSATLKKNTDLRIEERIVVDFSTKRHGIFRYIPVKQRSGIRNITTKITDVVVTNELGKTIPVLKTRKGQNLELKIGDPNEYVIGTQVYNIAYTISNVVQRYDNHDEVYWNVVGSGWDTIVSKPTFSFGSEFAEIEGAVCFTGPVGSTKSDCEIGYDENGVITSSNVDVKNGEDFTVAIILNKDNFLQFPGIVRKIQDFIFDNWGYLIAFLPAFIFLGLWYKKGRDITFGDKLYYGDLNANVGNLKLAPVFARPHLPTVYRPIEGLTPAQIGTLIDETVHIKDIVAEIVELARLRYIKITQFKKDYELARLKKEDSELLDYQKYLLNSLFPIGSEQSINTKDFKKLKFYTHLETLKKKIYESITKESKYFDANPDSVRKKWAVAATVLSLGIAILLGNMGSFQNNPFYLLALMISAFVAGIISKYMPRKTAKGYALSRDIAGLKNYLKIGKWRHDIYEKNLFIEEMIPIAISLGVVNKLAKQMKDLGMQAPSYFNSSTGSINLSSFEKTMSKSVFAGAPSSTKSSWSGGSGFSGGSSGGGFGGGGGGSW